MVKNKKAMTIKEFDLIKDMLNRDSIRSVKLQTGRASGTIYAVNKANNFSDYQRLVYEKNQRFLSHKKGVSYTPKPVTKAEYSTPQPNVVKPAFRKPDKKELAIVEVEKLDNLFNQIREQVTQTAAAIANYRAEAEVAKLREQLEEKDRKLADYDKVMEEAKNDNFVTNFKRKFGMD